MRGRALLGAAQACKSLIGKRFSIVSLARYCRILRPDKGQTGVTQSSLRDLHDRSSTAEPIVESPLRRPRLGEPAGGSSWQVPPTAEGSASSPFHTPMLRAVILQGCREKRSRTFDGELYKKCNRVERLVGGSSSADASSPAKR